VGREVKGGGVLEKIVILTDQSAPATHLVFLVNRVFPECEVHIVMNEEIFESQDLSD
jgi:hypothetical protein